MQQVITQCEDRSVAQSALHLSGVQHVGCLGVTSQFSLIIFSVIHGKTLCHIEVNAAAIITQLLVASLQLPAKISLLPT